MTTEKKERPGTEYVVLACTLQRDCDDEVIPGAVAAGFYHRLGTVTASNDIAAISATLGDEPTPGRYIAIPKRSFREREVTVSTVTQARVG